MDSKQKTPTSKSLERFPLSNKPRLVITKRLQQQIDWLHQKVGRNEWSGELITREEGNITDLQNWTIYAEDIYLADVGTGTFTGYQVDQGGFKAVDIVDMYEAFPGLLEGTHKAQHIHTHHDMKAFFSATDESNLEERAQAANYFLMLVVNFKGDYVAKVAFHATLPPAQGQVINFKNNHDGYEPMSLGEAEEKEVLVVMECEVVQDAVQDLLTPEFKARYDDVRKALREEADQKKNYTFRQGQIWDTQRGWIDNPNARVGRQTQIGFGEEEKEERNKKGGKGSSSTRQKRLSEMTDQEFAAYEREQNKAPMVWTERQFRAIFHAYMESDGTREDFSSIFNQMYDINSSLKTEGARTEWIAEFMGDLEYWMQVMYPDHSTLEDYLKLLAAGIRELQGYSMPFIVELKMALILEEEETQQELISMDGEDSATLEAAGESPDTTGFSTEEYYDEEWRSWQNNQGYLDIN